MNKESNCTMIKPTRPYILKNFIMDYPWGTVKDIPEFIGKMPMSGKPSAELWMGAHPKAPSSVIYNDEEIPLDKWISRYPVQVLGNKIAKKYSDKLPFLFKLISVESPLSVQVHPDLDKAHTGFERENNSGLALSNPKRNYHDTNHKPEMVYAISHFKALIGFKRFQEIKRNINPYRLVIDKEAGLRHLFRKIMLMQDKDKQGLIDSVIKLSKKKTHIPKYGLVIELFNRFGYDICVIAPLFYNLFELHPGDAMLIKPHTPHVYLKGFAIELMANSDNVIRGGLTRKHIDIEEFLDILNYQEENVKIIESIRLKDNEYIYKPDIDDFILSLIEIKKGTLYHSTPNHPVEILLVGAGEINIGNTKDEYNLALKKGDSIIIPSAAGKYLLSGEGAVYRSSVPTE